MAVARVFGNCHFLQPGKHHWHVELELGGQVGGAQHTVSQARSHRSSKRRVFGLAGLAGRLVRPVAPHATADTARKVVVRRRRGLVRVVPEMVVIGCVDSPRGPHFLSVGAVERLRRVHYQLVGNSASVQWYAQLVAAAAAQHVARHIAHSLAGLGCLPPVAGHERRQAQRDPFGRLCHRDKGVRERG